MRTVLVTGGLGFIGSHLASSLLDDADTTVVIVDNVVSSPLGVETVVHEISHGKPGRLLVKRAAVSKLGADTACDAIFHLASIVGPAAVINCSGRIARAIVSDAHKMALLAMSSGARLVNVSTSEIYGGGERGLCSEETPRVIKPKASARLEYAAGKLAAEVAIDNLTQTGKLDAITIRPFNVCGTRQLGRGGFVLPRFIGQALCGLPLTVFGDGQQLRAFTDVRDVVSGILLAAQRGSPGQAFNVGNPANRVTIRELAARVLDVTESEVGIAFVDPKSIYGQAYEEADDKFPDAGKLMNLGWKPKFSLNETIRSVYEYMRALPFEVMRDAAGMQQTDFVAGNARVLS